MAAVNAPASWLSLPRQGRPERVRGGFSLRPAGTMKSLQARSAILAEAGLGGRPAFYLRQVHGDRVVAVGADARFDPAPEADGWVTDQAGPVLCVYMADCLPILVWEKSGKAVGAFHAGWRGLAKGMPKAAVEAFKTNYGVAPQDLRAVVGPHVGACCYRVGPETAEQFPAEIRKPRGGATYLDLGQDAERQLRAAGIADVSHQAGCTSCHPDRFFSFRRDKSDDRMMAFVSLETRA